MPTISELNPEAVYDSDPSGSIVAFVDQCYRQDRESKRRLAMIWEENIRFFVGDQLIYYDQSTQSMQSITLPKRIGPRAIANRYTPSVLTVVSDLTRTEPGAIVLPDSNTGESVQRAKLAEKLRYQVWEDLEEPTTYIILALWLALTGTAFKEDVWDSGLGDLATSTYGPFNLGLPSYANEHFDEWNSPWIAKWTIQPVEWVKETYNQQGEGFYPENAQNVTSEAIDGPLLLYVRLRQSIARLGSLIFGGQIPAGDFVVHKELYLRPNSQHPKGRYYVVSGNQLVYATDSPYHMQLGHRVMWNPFTVFRYMPTLGRFWGTCPADDLVPLQRKINAIDAAVSIIRRKMGAPQWIVPNQCNVPNNYISGDAGQVIRYDARMNLKPERIEASIIPPSLWVERDKAEQEMALVSGDVDVLRAHQPRGARGVQALQLLTEIVSSRRAPVVKLWESGIARSERKKLAIYRLFAPEANIRRLAPYMDEFGMDFVKSFFGDNVPVNLRIEAGSTLPKLQASQQQQLLAAFKMGLLGSPDDPIVRKEIVSRLGITDVQTSWEVDIRKSQLENAAIMRGEFDQVDFTPWDNHMVEFQIHTMALKQPGFKAAPQQVIQFMCQHIVKHQQALMQAAMDQAAQAGGGMGAKPGAKPPGPAPAPKPLPADTNDGGRG